MRRIFIADLERKSLVDTRQTVNFGDALFELEYDSVELTQVATYPGRSASSLLLFQGEDGTSYKNVYAPIIFEQRVVALLGTSLSPVRAL